MSRYRPGIEFLFCVWYNIDYKRKGDKVKINIIENSLCDAEFSENARPEHLVAYIDSLLEFGASYIEMVTDAFLLLPPTSDLSKIILRMTSPRDLLYINSFDFPYVVLPANLTEYASEIKHPIISEISLHGSNMLQIMSMFEKTFDYSNVAMIRFVDDFKMTSAEMADVIRIYRSKCCRPIDICPTNRYTNAVDKAIAAVLARSDSITMRFGSYDKYAELQDYTISLATLYGVAPSHQTILALCKCDTLYRILYERNAHSALADLRENQIAPHYIRNTDLSLPLIPSERTIRSSYIRQPEFGTDKEDALYRKLRSMLVDDVTARELQDEIDKFCTRLFNPDINKKNS